MASTDLGAAMNAHLNKELYSAYQYLAMAAFFEESNYPGFASWMNTQAKEEYVHAMKFWDFLYDTGGRVTLLAIEKPRDKFSSPLDAFEAALQNERDVTKAIHALYDRAVEEHDYPSQVFLQWFVTEQVEEERMTGQIVETLKMMGDSTASILILDRELGQRGGAATS